MTTRTSTDFHHFPTSQREMRWEAAQVNYLQELEPKTGRKTRPKKSEKGNQDRTGFPGRQPLAHRPRATGSPATTRCFPHFPTSRREMACEATKKRFTATPCVAEPAQNCPPKNQKREVPAPLARFAAQRRGRESI